MEPGLVHCFCANRPALHYRYPPLAPPRTPLRHEEVHEAPQLHQVVLQRGAGDEQAALGVEVEQRLQQGGGGGQGGSGPWGLYWGVRSSRPRCA